MTPLRMRLFFVAFSALAVATSINALYLQEAPRHIAGVRTITPAQPVKVVAVEPVAPAPAAEPAPAQSSAQNPSTASIPQAEKSEPAQPPAAVAVHEPVAQAQAPAPTQTVPPPATEALPAPNAQVKSIQRELAARGYAPARHDGVLALETRAAILAYEFDEHLPLTGEASEALLKSLIFAKATGTPSKAKNAPADRFESRRDIVEKVQQMLAQFGYISAPADGQLDARTRDAIRKFENDRRMKPAGHLTERVLLEMVIVTGRPLPASS